jgi:Outer membrane protein beta-barrel domain
MKTILFALFLLSLSILVKAQDTHFGIKGGLNITSLDVKDGVDLDSKAGFHIGGLAHVHLSPHFAIQPELLYSTQGGKNGDTKWKLGYINVPLLLQVMTGTGFRFETGPQIGFAVSSKYKDGDIEYDYGDVTETVDVSWAVGISYLFPEGIGFDARYNHGLTDVYEPESYEIRNRVFQIGVFYQFMNTTPHNRKR